MSLPVEGRTEVEFVGPKGRTEVELVGPKGGTEVGSVGAFGGTLLRHPLCLPVYLEPPVSFQD